MGRPLTLIYSRLGKISGYEGNLEAAKQYYLQNLELCRQLCQEARTPEAMNDLAISCYNTSLMSEGETKKALLTEALDLWNQLCEKCPGISLFAQRRDIVRKKLDNV